VNVREVSRWEAKEVDYALLMAPASSYLLYRTLTANPPACLTNPIVIFDRI
jgi:hypothetical protein